MSRRITIADDIAKMLETYRGSATSIADFLGYNRNTVRGRLSEMTRAGEVVKNANGSYSLPEVVDAVN